MPHFKLQFNWLVSRQNHKISDTVRNVYQVVFGHKSSVMAVVRPLILFNHIICITADFDQRPKVSPQFFHRTDLLSATTQNSRSVEVSLLQFWLQPFL